MLISGSMQAVPRLFKAAVGPVPTVREAVGNSAGVQRAPLRWLHDHEALPARSAGLSQPAKFTYSPATKTSRQASEHASGDAVDLSQRQKAVKRT
jgi:hypothetical protein